ncbi:Tetratricopeptide repeat-containing protein [Giardia muris]|uniref:Outer dynein arm-docking complex subunit 4 n=1 Tax=Giardia muris TaxID=5742 RepID=A0A4Z1TAU4_GIAMU|nr:Tetratricopeptide repeat-containing protein [Giardia muris]|eukprot:TNJ30347.1 Tetratricopeptide repeat-containing protein [Giardia muris]
MEFATLQRLKLCRNEFDGAFRAMNYEKALAAINRGIDLNPDDIELYLRRSQCYTQMGRADDAIADAERAITALPEDCRGFQRKGDALFSAGEFEYALTNYYRGIEMRPDLSTHETSIQRCEDAIKKAMNYSSEDIATLFTYLDRGIIVEEKACLHGNGEDTFSLWALPELPKEEELSASQSTRVLLDFSQSPVPPAKPARQGCQSARERRRQITSIRSVDDREFLTSLKGLPSVQGFVMEGISYLDQREQYWRKLGTNPVETKSGRKAPPKSASAQPKCKLYGDLESYGRRRLLEVTKSGSNLSRLVGQNPNGPMHTFYASDSRYDLPTRSSSLPTQRNGRRVAQANRAIAPIVDVLNTPADQSRVRFDLQSTESPTLHGVASQNQIAEDHNLNSVSTLPTHGDALYDLQKHMRETAALVKRLRSEPVEQVEAVEPSVPKPSSARPRRRKVMMSVTDKRDYVGGYSGLVAETRSSSIRSQAFSRYILNSVTTEAIASKRKSVNPIVLTQELQELMTQIAEQRHQVCQDVRTGVFHDGIRVCKDVLARLNRGDRVVKALPTVTELRAEFSLYLGTIYSILDYKYAEYSRPCLNTLRAAVDYANAAKDPLLTVQTVRELAKAMINMGQAEKSIPIFKGLLRTFENLPLFKADTLLGLGRGYHDIGDYDNGIAYAREAIETYRAIYPDEDTIPDEFPDSGSKYFVLRELSPRHNYCFCLCIMGRCYLAQKNIKQAKVHLEHCKGLGKLWKDSTAWHTATELLRFVY